MSWLPKTRKLRPKAKGLPKTKRFCIHCNKNMVFKFNKILGHSECVECGYRFAERMKE